MFTRLSSKLTLLWLLITAMFEVAAQPPSSSEYDIRRIAVHDGMVNQTVTSLCQDGTGMLWVGTMDGLYTFDGVRLVRFESKRTGHDLLRMFVVNGIVVDTSGQNRVFVASSQGVLVIDPIKREVVSDATLGLAPGFLKSCLQIEKKIGGGYWLLGRDGLYKLEKSASQYEKQLVAALSGLPLPKIITDPAQPEAVWILSRDSVAYYQKHSPPQFAAIPRSKDNPVPWQGLEYWRHTSKGDIVGWDHLRNLYQFNAAQQSIERASGYQELYALLPMLKSVDSYMEQKPVVKCVFNVSSELVWLKIR